MSKFHEIKASEFNYSPFSLSNEWMLITAKKGNKTNTMTASWGGMGVLWGSDVAFIFVRQSRFTKEFIDGSDSFSLSFLDMGKYKKTLAYLGSASGRDEDKIRKSGLSVIDNEAAPYFNEARTVVICKKLSRHFISLEGMLDKTIQEKWYGDNDYHDLYVGKIEKILVSE